MDFKSLVQKLAAYSTPQAQVDIDCSRINEVLLGRQSALYVSAAVARDVKVAGPKLTVGRLDVDARVRLTPADAVWPLRERMSQQQLKRVYSLINPELQMREAEGWGAVEVDYDGAPIAREEARAALQDSDVQQLLRRAGFAGVFDDVYGCGGPEWKDVTFSAFAAELESRQPPHPAAVFIHSVPGVPAHLDISQAIEHKRVDGARLRSWWESGQAASEGDPWSERIAVELKEGLLGESLMSAHVRAVCAELGRVVAESAAPAGVGGTLARLVAKAAGTAASPRTVDIESVSVRIATPDGAPIQVMLSGAHVNLSGIGCGLSAASLRTEGGGAPFEASDVKVRFMDHERPLSVSAKHARVCWHPLLSAVVPATAVRSLKVGSLSVLVPGLPEFTVTGLDGRPHGDAPMNVTVSCPGVLPEPAQATWQDGGLTIAAGTAVTLNAEHWAALRRTVAEATQPPHRVGALGGTAAGVAIAAPAIELQCGDRPWTLKNGRLELRHSVDAAALTVSADEARAADGDRKYADVTGLFAIVTRRHDVGGVSVSADVGALALHSAEGGSATEVVLDCLHPLVGVQPGATSDISVGDFSVVAPRGTVRLGGLHIKQDRPEHADPQPRRPHGTSTSTCFTWRTGEVITPAGSAAFLPDGVPYVVRVTTDDSGGPVDVDACMSKLVTQFPCTPGDLPGMACTLLDTVRTPGCPRSQVAAAVSVVSWQHVGWEAVDADINLTVSPYNASEEEEVVEVHVDGKVGFTELALAGEDGRGIGLSNPVVTVSTNAGMMDVTLQSAGLTLTTGSDDFGSVIANMVERATVAYTQTTQSLRELRSYHNERLHTLVQEERQKAEARAALHQTSGGMFGIATAVFAAFAGAPAATGQSLAIECAEGDDEEPMRRDPRCARVIADYSAACVPTVEGSSSEGPMRVQFRAHIEEVSVRGEHAAAQTTKVSVVGVAGEQLAVEATGLVVIGISAQAEAPALVLHTGGGVKAEYDGEVRVSLDGGLTADLRDRVPAAAVADLVRQLRFGDTKVSVQTPTSTLFMLPQEPDAVDDCVGGIVRRLLSSIHANETDGGKELHVCTIPMPALTVPEAVCWFRDQFTEGYIDALSWRGLRLGIVQLAFGGAGTGVPALEDAPKEVQEVLERAKEHYDQQAAEEELEAVAAAQQDACRQEEQQSVEDAKPEPEKERDEPLSPVAKVYLDPKTGVEVTLNPDGTFTFDADAMREALRQPDEPKPRPQQQQQRSTAATQEILRLRQDLEAAQAQLEGRQEQQAPQRAPPPPPRAPAPPGSGPAGGPPPPPPPPPPPKVLPPRFPKPVSTIPGVPTVPAAAPGTSDWLPTEPSNLHDWAKWAIQKFPAREDAETEGEEKEERASTPPPAGGSIDPGRLHTLKLVIRFLPKDVVDNVRDAKMSDTVITQCLGLFPRKTDAAILEQEAQLFRTAEGVPAHCAHVVEVMKELYSIPSAEKPRCHQRLVCMADACGLTDGEAGRKRDAELPGLERLNHSLDYCWGQRYVLDYLLGQIATINHVLNAQTGGKQAKPLRAVPVSKLSFAWDTSATDGTGETLLQALASELSKRGQLERCTVSADMLACFEFVAGTDIDEVGDPVAVLDREWRGVAAEVQWHRDNGFADDPFVAAYADLAAEYDSMCELTGAMRRAREGWRRMCRNYGLTASHETEELQILAQLLQRWRDVCLSMPPVAAAAPPIAVVPPVATEPPPVAAAPADEAPRRPPPPPPPPPPPAAPAVPDLSVTQIGRVAERFQ